MILILIIIFILIYFYKSKKYKEESYYKITKVDYFDVRYNKGKYGEYLTYKYLKRFEKQGAKFLFNIYVPKKDEETTEIDVLMISNKGIFVFESKNYSGWIFGSDNQKYWYQILPAGRRRNHKQKFYNPVFQNKTHVKYLKSLLGEIAPMHSIITFSDRCTLKNINIQNSMVKVIKRYQVYNLISSIYNNSEDYLSNEQIDEIYNKLYPYTQVDEITKQKHIDSINNIKEINNNMYTLSKKNDSIDEKKNTVETDDSINTSVIIEKETDLTTNLNDSEINIVEDNEKNKEE